MSGWSIIGISLEVYDKYLMWYLKCVVIFKLLFCSMSTFQMNIVNIFQMTIKQYGHFLAEIKT